MTEPHPAVAALFEASPKWDDLVFTGVTEDETRPGRYWPTWSPQDHPAGLAAGARQTAAILRWYAQWMVDNAPHGCGCLTSVVEIADEIDAQYLTQEGQTRS